MIINKNSWHYKLVTNVTFRDSYRGSVPQNLCPYFRAVMYRVVFFATILTALCGMLIGMCWPAAAHLLTSIGIGNKILIALTSLGMSVITLGSLVGLAVLIAMGIHKLVTKFQHWRYVRYESKLKEKQSPDYVEPEKGIINAFLTAKHNKICPKLEFK